MKERRRVGSHTVVSSGGSTIKCLPQHLLCQLAATSLPGESDHPQRQCWGGGREQGVSPSLSVPFHTSFSLFSSACFAFERALPVKKAPAHESKCQRLHQTQRTGLISDRQQGRLHPTGLMTEVVEVHTFFTAAEV